MNIVIIDDDLNFINQISEDISAFFKERNTDTCISYINNNFHNIPIKDDYNIVIIDINLLSDNGIELGTRIRRLNPLAHIIFASSENNYVFQTFDIRPFFFLRKSYYKQDCETMLKMLNRYIKEDTVITLTSRASKTYVSINSIMYIEAYRHVLHIHTRKEVYYDNSTLESFMKQLPSDNFVQIQRSFILNMDYLRTIDTNEIILINGNKLPVGRKYRESFLNKYQEYLVK